MVFAKLIEYLFLYGFIVGIAALLALELIIIGIIFIIKLYKENRKE